MSEAQQPAPAPASADPRTYVVDRIEAGIAVLVADEPPAQGAPDETSASVRELPAGVAEGDVLRVPVWPDGTPVWQAAVPDPSARAQRLKEAEERLARLRKRDPGGDIVL